ncbi:MAG: GbsR/MarR family transcriptional regulator [Candidatus Aenigmatarchaeota archaeon]
MKEIEREIYSTFSNIASSIGYSEIHGRIIATLLVKGKKLPLQELAKETGYSTSTISLSLDLLEVLGMIKKIKKAGDRKLYVEIQGDLLEGLKKAFLIRIQKSVDDTLEQFKKYKKVKDKNVINTLNILEKEVKRINKYINLLSKLKLP